MPLPAKWRTSLGLAALFSCAVLLAACGSSSTSPNASAASAGGSGGSSGSSSQSNPTAKLAPTPPTTPVTDFPITTPLKTKPPHKSIAWLACELPTCQGQLSVGYKTAAAALGWSFRQINYKTSDPAPAVQQALDDNVNYIAITGIPPVAFQQQAKEAAQRHIPIISCFDTTQPAPSTNGLYMQCANTYGYGLQAKQLADWMINDSNGKANVLMVNIEAYPILVAEQQAIKAEFAQRCSGCQLNVLPVTVDDVGAGKVPSKIIAALQSHPGTNYLELAFSDLGLGVPQALAGAGLSSQVKVVGVQSDKNALQGIGDGKIAAWTAQAQGFAGWLSLDAMARLSEGMPLTSYQKSGQLPSWVVDSKTQAQTLLNGVGEWPGPAGYQQKFSALWSH
jgi:ABC-type sugar transport system substrate-binding protein